MHTETIVVYFDDLDAMGVVHNAKYVTLLERALAGYWTRASRGAFRGAGVRDHLSPADHPGRPRTARGLPPAAGADRSKRTHGRIIHGCPDRERTNVMQQHIRHGGPGREDARLDRVRLNEALTHVVFGGQRRRVNARITALSGVQPGDRVLDIGCGGGYLARVLAATVGPAG